MKLLFASDSFKGTLSSEKTIELLTKAANAAPPKASRRSPSAAASAKTMKRSTIAASAPF